MTARNGLGIIAALSWIAAVGCSSADQRVAATSEAVISDAVHDNGTAGFYFLPPLVAAPTLTTAFDGNESPTVRIDELSPTGALLRTIATYTTTTGPGSETVRVDLAGQQYVVNWHTDQFTLNDANIYRIHVIDGAKELGIADVDTVATGAQARNVDTNEYVPLVDGRTLPIKFWMNRCAPVVCTALDQCHAVGVCDPSSGTCSNPSQADGTGCNDGNACTQTDACQAGACVGTNPVVCTALDQCHSAGSCDPSTGACSNPTKPDGSACSDGNACTQTDACQAGTCLGANPIVCTALDECHVAGTCDPASGQCSNPPKTDACAVLPLSGGTTTIGAAGGEIYTSDGAVALHFPPGALAGDTAISVVPVAVTPNTDGVVGIAYDLQPEGTTFAAPVTLTIAYPPAQIPDWADETELGVLTSTADGDGLWDEEDNTSVDTTSHTATAELTHFSVKFVAVRTSSLKGVPKQVTVTKSKPLALGPIAHYSRGRLPLAPPQTLANRKTRFGVPPNSVATVSSTGVITGTTIGTSTVNVSSGAASSPLDVTVVAAPSITLFSAANPIVVKGQQATLAAEFSDGVGVIDQGIGPIINGGVVKTAPLNIKTTFTLTVTNAAGTVATAQATVDVLSSTGATYDCSSGFVAGDDPNRLLGIHLDPPAANVLAAAGGTKQFTAYGYYRRAPTTAVDITSLVNWSSSDGATVSIAGGTASYGAATGEVTLTASLNGMSANAHLRVWDPARFAALTAISGAAPGAYNMSSGACAPVTMTASFSDGTSEDVTNTALWGSSCLGRVIGQNLFVATGPCSDNYGSFIGSLGLGSLSTTVSIAIWGPVLAGTCSDPRSPGDLWGVTLQGASSIYVGEAVAFTAKGLYADGTTRDISSQVTFGTCDPTLVQLDDDGLATGRGVGSGPAVAAVLSGVSGIANESITTAPTLGALTGVTLNPDNANVALGGTYQFRAIGSYAGVPGHLINVSDQAIWSASSSASPPAGGIGIGNAIGKAQVTAALGTTTVTGNLRVWDATRLASINGFSVAGNGNMSHLGSQQWSFVAQFSDGTSEDVSDTSLWSPHSSCWGHLSTTGFFTADGSCTSYDIIYVAFGRTKPTAIEFGIW